MGGIPHQSSYPPSDYVYLVCLQAEETRNLNSGIYNTNKSVTKITSASFRKLYQQRRLHSRPTISSSASFFISGLTCSVAVISRKSHSRLSHTVSRSVHTTVASWVKEVPAHRQRYILGRDDLQSPATGTPFHYYGILSKDRNDNIIDSYTDVGVDQAHLLLSAWVLTRQDLLFSGALPLTPPPQPTQQLFTQFLRRLLLRLLATKRNRKQ